MVNEWTIKARFRIGGYEFREIDITPALGVLVVGLFTYLLAIDPSSWR